MKHVATICIVGWAAFAATGWAAAGDIIAEDPLYKPSSNLEIGPIVTIHSGHPDYELTGYSITEEFQINLLYQAGILNEDIDNINHYWQAMGSTYNFPDNEEYVLNISAVGGLTIYEFDGLRETVGGPDIKWTLTGWHQTVLAGDVIDNGDGTITLQVLPVGTYRPFVNDPPVNDVEVFDGNLDCEVLGYDFTGAVVDIGDGSVLSPELVHENSVASSTIHFEGALTVSGDAYVGVIDATAGTYYMPGGPGAVFDGSDWRTPDGELAVGGFDLYAEQGADAFYDDVFQGVVGPAHDGYPSTGGGWGAFYSPDVPDWHNYELVLTDTTWTLRYKGVAEGAPMSGQMCWSTSYASETDTGSYRGTVPADPDANDGGAADLLGCPGYAPCGAGHWDMDWTWGSEAIPLQYAGYNVDVQLVSGDVYHVTLTPAAPPNAFETGAARLVDLQNDDGGWDWPLDDGDPGNTSPKNTLGPIAMGLANAYRETGKPAVLDALRDAGGLLLSKTNDFSPSDGYLAAQLDAIFGGSTYVDHVNDNFYGPLAAGNYDRNGAGTLYTTAAYVDMIRSSRASQNIPNLAAWDVGMGLVGAASAGADTAAWVDGTKAEIDELDGADSYDVIGLAGAVYGLAFVGEDFDPASGEHAAASSLADLADILAEYQIAESGGFAWDKDHVIPYDYNETVQETAYAILALAEFGGYDGEVAAAADYLESVQLCTGGWENYVGSTSGENNEITGEALWALWTCSHGELTLEPDYDCYADGDVVTVELWMRDIAEDIAGGQFYLQYDDSLLENPAVAPAGSFIELWEVVSTPGQIDYAVYLYQPATVTGDQHIATITFDAKAQICSEMDLVAWISHNPATGLTTHGGRVYPALINMDVVDIEPPVLTCPENLTLQCDGNGNTTAINDWLDSASADDNCGDVVITNDFDSDLLVGCCGTGAVLVTWTAVDDCGNTSTCTATVAVQDTTPPSITCPPDRVLECPADTHPDSTGYATAVDVCCGGATVEWSDVVVNGCGNTYTITRTWTAVDDCGNENTCPQTISVEDHTPPHIDMAAQNQTVECDGYGNVADLSDWLATQGGAAATDACGAVTWSYYPDPAVLSDLCGATGAVTVIFTATDECGNFIDTSATFTIVDTTNPVISGCPDDITVYADAGACDAVVTWTEPTADDVCGMGDFVSDYMPGDTFPQGDTTVTYTAADDCGNVSECTFTVTVLAYNELVVDVKLDGYVLGPLNRCITFELWKCDTLSSVEVKSNVAFDLNGFADDQIVLVPCGEYECITARDALHTLRHTVPIVNAGTQYTADFTGDAALIGGNLDQDEWVDIMDFGVFSWKWTQGYYDGVEVASPPYNGDTPCGSPYPHADIDGSGLVDLADFTFISNNFLEGSDPDCCPTLLTLAGDRGPVREISVEDLQTMGYAEFATGDLNGDGWLDEADVVAFLNGARPKPHYLSPAEAVRKRTDEEPGGLIELSPRP